MTDRTQALAELIVQHIDSARPGHCLRVDDLALEDAINLQRAVSVAVERKPLEASVRVCVLDTSESEGRVTVEQAIGIRNDIAVTDHDPAILILLVPPAMAREASSLDNAFERLPYAELLERSGRRIIERLRIERPDFPANELLRMSRRSAPVEHWLEFLEVVDSEPRVPFGKQLWRIGLMPDCGDDADVRGRLRDNDAFVRKIIDPAAAGHAVSDRLRQTRLAPGETFNRLVEELTAHEDHLDDVRHWAKAVANDANLGFDSLDLIDALIASDLEEFQVLPFRSPTGSVAKSTGLKLVNDNLVCEIAEESEGKVRVRWRTIPTKTTVHRWAVRLVHPEDLRSPDEEPLSEMRVAGAKQSTTLKIDLTSDDITGGFLYVVEVLPFDADDQPIQMPDSAVTESEAFELVFTEAQPGGEEQTSSTASSLGVARLRAVSRGASSLDESHPVWDWNRQQFSLRIGGSRSVQVPAHSVIVHLEKQIVADPTIVGYAADSPYGLALQVQDFKALRDEIPPALARRRAAIMELLLDAVPRDVPEVFPWDDQSRELVLDYLGSYKRALDSAEGVTRQVLLRLDTVKLSVGDVADTRTSVTVVLPLHPIRLAWLTVHDQITRGWAYELLQRADAAAGRKDAIDFDGLSRISPSNLPFSVANQQNSLDVYFDELAFGVGLLVPLGHPAPEVIASTVSTVFGLVRQSESLTSDAGMIADRLAQYRTAHPDPQAIRIAAMHPGDGAVLAGALANFLKRVSSDPLRLDVVAYGGHNRYTNPLSPLTRLQVTREGTGNVVTDDSPDDEHSRGRYRKQSPLFPPIGASVRPLERIVVDTESIHVSLACSISDLEVAPTPPAALDRFASLEDLLCPLVTSNIDEEDRGWTISPALNARTSSASATIVATHRSHQSTTGAELDLNGPPALRVVVNGDTLNTIGVLHERSDWVLTLDRFVGLNFYEGGHFRQGTTNYILDYAPDFIDGMSHRLTVTTCHRAEVTSILRHALTDLGLDSLDASATQVLDDLMAVSGRLILRLQSSDGFARESVSLAALVAHLRKQDKLDGAIIVPVDSHQEIFGRNAPHNETGRRCDMLIVRVSQRKFRIECIEVKSRRYAALPTDLADGIAEQLENTKDLLEQRYFANDPPRIDAALQRAQLAGLLHYYADRAVTNGLIPAEKVADTHKHIDSLIEGGVEVEISMQGYVISLTGSAGIPSKHRGIPISVLTAADLGKAGFSILPTTTPPGADSGFTHGESTNAPASNGEDSSTASEVSESDGTDVPIVESSDDPPWDETTVDSDSTDVPQSTGSNQPSPATQTDAPVEPLSGGNAAFTGTDKPAGAREVEVAVGKDTAGTPVSWMPSTKGSPHAFIVGIPGQGKSVTTRRLIRELASQGLPSLVIDFHGDMAADPPANADVLSADTGLPFTPFETLLTDEPAKLNQAAWELAEVIQFVGAMGEIQRSSVYKALQEVYKNAVGEHRVPTVSEFAAALEDIEHKGRGSQNARERVRPLTDFGLFDESAAQSFNPRQAGMVVDLSKLMLDEVQIAATSFLLRKVYRDMFSWPQDGTLKLAIVLDEAHRVAKDVTLPKLMKEGRKYGVVVVVASQGLSDFHKDVLGNSGMKIVFRTNHPESKTVARYLRGRAGQDLSIEVEKLGVGQAYVSTPDMPQARKTAMFE